MDGWNRWWMAVLSLVLVTGCATPRHETWRDYVVPADSAGQACVAACAQTRQQCTDACQAAWQACGQALEPQVDGRHAQALAAYSQALRHYRQALDQAAWEQMHWDLWMGWGFRHGGLWYSPWPPGGWPGWPAPLLVDDPGDPPTRESVREAMQAEACRDDCGCGTDYDRCFQSCGGRIETRTRCVAHCRDAPAFASEGR